jgi:hypothetical protein
MKKTFSVILILALIANIVLLSIAIYKYDISINPPKQGAILRYEDFRGYKVPIKADGKGGEYRWMKDVPWNVFSIEEKFEWAKVNGGWLNDKDIQEIQKKYGAR